MSHLLAIVQSEGKGARGGKRPTFSYTDEKALLLVRTASRSCILSSLQTFYHKLYITWATQQETLNKQHCGCPPSLHTNSDKRRQTYTQLLSLLISLMFDLLNQSIQGVQHQEVLCFIIHQKLMDFLVSSRQVSPFLNNF